VRIHLYAQCWNDEWMLPYFFRHYDGLVDRYVIFDDESNDGTSAILRNHPRVEIRRFIRSAPDSFVLSEQHISNECWKESRGKADWVILTDIDEHLCHYDGRSYFEQMAKGRVTLIPALGFQMISEILPSAADTLSDVIARGAPWEKMMKPSVFNPDEIDEIGYSVGRHRAEPVGHVRVPDIDELLLLHYKYINLERTHDRHVQLRNRLGPADISNRWGHKYSWSADQLLEDWKDVSERSIEVRAFLRSSGNYPLECWWEKYRREGLS
jgi:Glycosyl transferase family 2